MQGILSDAASAVERVLPLPEIEEMRNLIDATITGTLDILQVGLALCGYVCDGGPVHLVAKVNQMHLLLQLCPQRVVC